MVFSKVTAYTSGRKPEPDLGASPKPRNDLTDVLPRVRLFRINVHAAIVVDPEAEFRSLNVIGVDCRS